MKIVINRCYGGFGLSDAAKKEYFSRTGKAAGYDMERNDPVLVSLVEEMGEGSWDGLAKLRIVEIPDDVKWVIEEYDGIEWVSEVHRTWTE